MDCVILPFSDTIRENKRINKEAPFILNYDSLRQLRKHGEEGVFACMAKY